MFWAGCGADQNRCPRRTVELAEKYGQQMSDAVDQVLTGELTPVAGRLHTRTTRSTCPFATLPTTRS